MSGSDEVLTVSTEGKNMKCSAIPQTTHRNHERNNESLASAHIKHTAHTHIG